MGLPFVNKLCVGLAQVILSVALLCINATLARADDWNAALNDGATLPPKVVAVDKKEQQLRVYKRQSPLKLDKLYSCTTGQKGGDKIFSGDLRTPEGVYFIVDKVGQTLNFDEYGGIAYALNYPNPMDRLKGKTGHGIWIHSRGHPITPLETRGCVAVNLDAMEELAPRLAPGTPVVVAETVRTDAAPSSPDATVAGVLEKKTRQWNAAWAARSKSFFDFYEPGAYSKAQGESFQSFQGTKDRLFTTLPWIQIVYGDIQVLRGPDYWVSWFPQYYRAPNMTSEGIRRLYWQPNAAGELRIVGMEWLPQDMGMETAFLETVTPGITQFIEDWRKAWLSGNIKQYMTFYAPNAQQKPRTSAAAIEQHKRATWSKNKPAQVELTGLRVMVLQNGISVDMTQVYRDSSGYRDKGIKKVLLHPKGDSWIIASEEWSPVAP